VDKLNRLNWPCVDDTVGAKKIPEASNEIPEISRFSARRVDTFKKVVEIN
jgi:hypothetical protein